MISRDKMTSVLIWIISLFLLSFVIIGVGSYYATGRQDQRLQVEYNRDFEDVLKADHYRELVTDILDNYSEINHVYLAYDENDSQVGFIVDISVVDANGETVNLLEGITYDGAQLTGIRRGSDSEQSSVVSDEELMLLSEQLVGHQIPVAIDNQQNIILDESVTPSYLRGLNDGVYYAQMLNANNRGYIDYVEIEVSGGVISRVQWDAFNTDPTTPDRRAASLSGAYQESGELWATQAYNLCHALINVQNPDLLAMKSDGTTEIVEGVTVNIRAFVTLAWECIDNSRAGFDKDDYQEALDGALTDLFGVSASENGLVNSNGFIVFSFSEYPNFLNSYDDEGNVTVTMNIREYHDRNIVDGETDTDYDDGFVPEEPENNYDGSEDGLVIGDAPVDMSNFTGIPISEIRTFIDGIPDNREDTEVVLTAVNTTYKFLKDYLHWMA